VVLFDSVVVVYAFRTIISNPRTAGAFARIPYVGIKIDLRAGLFLSPCRNFPNPRHFLGPMHGDMRSVPPLNAN